jgi:hypothetical protein
LLGLRRRDLAGTELVECYIGREELMDAVGHVARSIRRGRRIRLGAPPAPRKVEQRGCATAYGGWVRAPCCSVRKQLARWGQSWGHSERK